VIHEEAVARCAELNGEPERDRQWFARQTGPGAWEIVSVPVPGGPRGPLKEVIETRSRPDDQDDRSTIMRNIPPYGPAV